jgi:hypothetical protein
MTEVGDWEGGGLVEDLGALSGEGLVKDFGVKDFSELLRF